ncbi:uncharacterized protein K452DRAFT_235787 [Aplosporella prunicola CBS 121167]|uniref:Uncharacterized protein n=1 Tax=Aplosporella prunicola CBS 121167 TaxID=1176127 RepID=A0A6A6AZU0_9PEZI|nr:uncharacterized protein K452DRAFT_235787 [Aplosporella prunicola CBS 121167]KAF2137462.1 hypothetical protein K452DRAFT_235787 [Aplosporella prunicola CBS 121167]
MAPWTGYHHPTGESQFELQDTSYDSAKDALKPTVQTTTTSASVSTLGDKPPENATRSRLWTPVFLRKSAVIGFICLYIALAVTLGVLQALDIKRQGLATTMSTRHFLWTYGPTAILAMVATGWGQLEHRTKQMTPWAKLRSGPTQASKALLLDYVSEAQPNALWASLKASDYAVALAITGSLLLKLLTVLSTGLLTLQLESRQHNHIPLVALDHFDASVFNTSLIDATPALSVVAFKSLNMSYPPGTSDSYAIPTLEMRDHRIEWGNITIKTTIDTFHADLTCEPANMTTHNVSCTSSGCELVHMDISVESASCKFKKFTWPNRFSFSWRNTVFGSAFAASAQCSNEESNRFVLATGLLDLGSDIKNITARVENSTVLVCEPHYIIKPADITIDSNGALLDVSLHDQVAPNKTLPLLSEWDLLEGVISSLSEAYSSLSLMPSNQKPLVLAAKSTPSIASFSSFFTLMGAVTRISNDTFTDYNFLERESRRLYSLVAAQIAKSNIMTPEKENHEGTCHVTEQRLRIRGLSLYFMQATLGVLTITTACLYSLVPRAVTSGDPGTIGGLAAIMARSRDLSAILSSAGALKLESLRSLLSNYKCETVVGYHANVAQFSIEVQEKMDNTDIEPKKTTEETDQKGHWWHPFSANIITKSIIAALLLLLVLPLELIYQKSRHSGGLADVDQESYIRYTWAYVPAAVMIAMQLLAGMIGFTARIFSPYYYLRMEPSVAHKAILSDQVSRMTIHSLCSSIKDRHYAITTTALSMLLIPFFTIAVSGLYAARAAQIPQDVSFGFSNVFNSSYDPEYISSDNGSLIMNMLLKKNLSDPLWTHGELAFPKISFATNDSLPPFPVADGSNFSVVLPALRANLDCTFISGNQLGIEKSKISEYRWITFPNTTKCGDALSTGWEYDGKPFGTLQVAVPLEMSVLTPPANCPRVAVTYGTSPDSAGINGMTCLSSIQELQVNTTFLYPSYQIVEAEPFENTTKVFSDGALSLVRMNSTLPYTYRTNDTFDATFQTILSRSNVSIEGRMGESAFPALVEDIQHLYRMSFAQIMNQVGRMPAPSGMEALNGTIINANRLRMMQTFWSTRILQFLLALTAICVAISAYLMDTRETLPKNPCSIAAAASLLASSEMLKEGVIPRGSEWCTDKEMEQKGIFQSYLFSLGWWGEKGTPERRFGIDIGRAEWSK